MSDTATVAPTEDSSKPVDSIEVDEVKEEEEEEEVGDEGDEGEGAQGGEVTGPSGRLSRELLKEMKAICDMLSTYQVTSKGDG